MTHQLFEVLDPLLRLAGYLFWFAVPSQMLTRFGYFPMLKRDLVKRRARKHRAGFVSSLYSD